ncbi:glycosyltransferase [Paroceanicella profunda]|uniref:Glycosyltransferase n=1 Tax=Paroceanicella profunda TaxID=2579971 RepID=A0A5B8FGL5_9RHOB|nr:glycosyltransferase [Paroceanicella profunda]QDL91137.1 glycosyltransferase [Paroceanicella profunda]
MEQDEIGRRGGRLLARLREAALRLRHAGAFCVWYARRPRVMAEHIAHASRTLRRHGLSAFVADLRNASNQISHEAGLAQVARLADRDALRVARQAERVQGTILIVVHDMEMGGAQQVARLFALWLIEHTRYRVKFVAMRDGPFRKRFEAMADTFCISSVQNLPHRDATLALRKWAGRDVKAIFVNSVASGGFYDYWPHDTPSVAFIHELPKILDRHRPALDNILRHATRVLGGSDAVRDVLASRYRADPRKLDRTYAYIPDGDVPDPRARRQARRRAGADEDTLLVCGSGVLHWRKSPDVFIDVAARVAEKAPGRVRFVWVGGGPDQAVCEALIAERGLGDTVSITGYLPDIDLVLNGADVFLLPSQEDPFPLAALHAARAGAPVICFDDAGGMPEFVSRGAGVSVPFGDAEAMAAEVLAYLVEPERRKAEGMRGRRLVGRNHTIGRVGPVLLNHIREAAGLKPAVSVVVPNYNYERFLPERLESILGQTMQDFELILLDDASTDGSRAILERYANLWPGARLVVNAQNTGSPFAQWLRGMDLARSDLVWMAEADDSCEPELLSTLLPAFDDRNVMLGHVRSVPVGDDGAVLGDYEKLYLDRIAPGRWSRPFLATDHEEINAGLGIANSIPNASGMIFRKFVPEPDFAAAVTSMKLCGDWYFYLRALRGGLIAYEPGAVNRHRRHSLTVTHRLEGTQLYFDELAQVRRFIARTWRQGPAARARARGFVEQDLARFPAVAEETAADARAALEPAEPTLPCLLMVISDLGPGGGQLFGVRFANQWTRMGGRVVLLNARAYRDHPAVVSKIDPRVLLLERGQAGADLPGIVRRFGVDVIHSSLWWADRHVLHQIRRLEERRPWVVTMHGCHESMEHDPRIDRDFQKVMARMVGLVDAWAYTADKNRAVFERIEKPSRIEKLINGIELESAARPLTRAELGLREDALVLCLASRAIPEKGWREAVELVAALNADGRDTDLMLIGEGPEAEALAAELPENVRFFGQVANLQDYFDCADVGLLPTRFRGESFPLVVLEMMARGRAVVTTDAGVLSEIVGAGPEAAGVVVPLIDGEIDTLGLRAAVLALSEPEARRLAGERGRARFEEHYTVERMVAAYLALYRGLGVGTTAPK